MHTASSLTSFGLCMKQLLPFQVVCIAHVFENRNPMHDFQPPAAQWQLRKQLPTAATPDKRCHSQWPLLLPVHNSSYIADEHAARCTAAAFANCPAASQVVCTAAAAGNCTAAAGRNLMGASTLCCALLLVDDEPACSINHNACLPCVSGNAGFNPKDGRCYA